MSVSLFPLIGIDIGSSSVKIVELSSGRFGKRKLKALGLEVIPNDAVIDGVIHDEAVLEKVIRELLERLKISPQARRAAVAVGGSTVQVKRITMDSAKSDIDEQINFEAEQHLQMDMADIYFRYQQLEGAADPAKTPVVMVGARRDTVEQYVGLIRNIGLRTGVVDGDILCLSNMFEMNYQIPNALVAVIDVGAAFTRLVLHLNGQCLFMKELNIGGDEYTRQVMEIMGVDYNSAETMKLAASQGSTPTPPELQKIITELNELLLKEISQSIEFYFQNAEPTPGVQGLAYAFLSGGGCRITGLDAAIAGALQVPIQIVNPFNHIAVNPKLFDVDYILMQGHLYSVAVGLAIRAMGDQGKP